MTIQLPETYRPVGHVFSHRDRGTMQAHRATSGRPGLSSCRPGRMAAIPSWGAQQARPHRGGRRSMRVVADYRLGGEESERVRGLAA